MSMTFGDAVKQKVAEHWNRRAPTFDTDFGHSLGSAGERAAWNRVLDLVTAGRGELDALDVGCGTGFLALELAARGHQAVGVDFAIAMLVEARRKARELGAGVRFEEADAEQLPYPPASFDLVVSRHLLWTLPHPDAAIDEWIRVLRPGGRLVVVDGQFAAAGADREQQPVARRTDEYATVMDQLPFMGGRPMNEIVTLLRHHGLADVHSDPFEDLVAAQNARRLAEGIELRNHARYAVWGDVPN
jgi:ubiquinone/menaquinone biosynthesis C-methylase UbiE